MFVVGRPTTHHALTTTKPPPPGIIRYAPSASYAIMSAARSCERRKAVRIAASWFDLRECLRMEAAAEVAKTRPPLQPTGARSRYVTLPAAMVKPCAEPDARLEVEEADAVCGGRMRLPRIGVAFQATKLPSYAPRCAHALLGVRPAGTAVHARSLFLT